MSDGKFSMYTLSYVNTAVDQSCSVHNSQMLYDINVFNIFSFEHHRSKRERNMKIKICSR